MQVRNGSVADRLRRMSSDRDGCRVWTGSVDRYGYGRITIRPRGVLTAHRVAWELAHGQIPGGMVVRHTCDNPPCIRIEHLELGTVSDNNNDRVSRGRSASASGEHNGYSKLTEQDVRDIRIRAKSGETQRSLADAYGVKQSNVSQIVRRVTWAHVT